MTALAGKAAICGVGQSPYGRHLGRSSVDLGFVAIRNALDDAGLTRQDLDGMIVSFGSPAGADVDTLASMLGLDLRLSNQTWGHGRFTATCIQWAAMAVVAGLADVVACLAAVDFSTSVPASATQSRREGGGPYLDDPSVGLATPGAAAALVARKYFDRFGATSADLATVPITFRRHAALNPLAMFQTPITVADHQAAPFVCEPLRLLDYCPVNDGAACVLVTTVERARDLRTPPVIIAGGQGLPAGRQEFIWAYPGFGIARQHEYTAAARDQPVYGMAGVGRGDVDALYTYDAFSILPWMALERWGFCGPGEAKDFTRDGRIELGGELPMNTNGGLLSEGHVMGWNHQIEIVRQLRGECGERQVPDAAVIQWANVYGDSIIYRAG